jgi:hypothetical protein
MSKGGGYQLLFAGLRELVINGSIAPRLWALACDFRALDGNFRGQDPLSSLEGGEGEIPA